MLRHLINSILVCAFLVPVSAHGQDPTPRCDAGTHLPKVAKAEHVKITMGKRVILYGKIKRIPMSKGKGKWQGTGLVLVDGTVVYITYGDPPPEWERFLDERVCVRGRLLNWSSLTKQSIVGPHLSELDFPIRIDKENRPIPSTALAAKVGRYVTLAGTARDAKGGAVLVLQGKEPVYIDELPSWPEKLHGKKVKAKGTLRHRQYLPEAKVDEKGAISQGTVGKQYVLENAQWEAK
jgi:hypothetical protein